MGCASMHNMRKDFKQELERLARIRFGEKWASRLAKVAGLSHTTIPRLLNGREDRPSDVANLRLRTLQAISIALGVEPTYWFEIHANTIPGRDMWGDLIVTHGLITEVEALLLSELLYSHRRATDSQKKGLSSHVTNLAEYIRKKRKKA